MEKYYQFSLVIQSCLTLQTHRLHHARPPLWITDSMNWLKLMSIESVLPPNHLILCHPLLLLPSIFPSMRVFSNESALRIRWPKYWSFSFIVNPSNEYSGLISFRIDYLDLLAVWGPVKRALHSSKHHSLNTTVQKHQFFGTQLSFSPTLTSIHDYGKNHSLN